MKRHATLVLLFLAVALAGGVVAAKKGINPTALYKGRTPTEAAEALLTQAEERAGSGSWELIAVGRAWYLGGDKARGQALFDKVTGAKPEASDYFRLARIYLEAGENDRAWEAFEKASSMAPKDDSGMLEIGARLNVAGQRAKAEDYFDRGFAKSPNGFWHLVVSGGSYLGVHPD